MLRLTLLLCAGLTVTSGAAAQSRDVVLDSNGRPVAPWVSQELCLPPDKTCKVAIRHSQTGEIAMFGGKVTKGFDATGRSQELARGSAPRPNGRTVPDTKDDRVIDAADVIVPPWKSVRGCTITRPDRPKDCANYIRHPSGDVAQFNGEWGPDFAPTGNGKEVARRGQQAPR